MVNEQKQTLDYSHGTGEGLQMGLPIPPKIKALRGEAGRCTEIPDLGNTGGFQQPSLGRSPSSLATTSHHY